MAPLTATAQQRDTPPGSLRAAPDAVADVAHALVTDALDIGDRRHREAEQRASRLRIVAAADAARRRIERDLHDGAQQRLVALALQLRHARARADDDPLQVPGLLDAAIAELAAAT